MLFFSSANIVILQEIKAKKVIFFLQNHGVDTRIPESSQAGTPAKQRCRF